MTDSPIPAEWLDFNNETVDALLEDGSHLKSPTIEFHIAGAFPELEKAVDCSKPG